MSEISNEEKKAAEIKRSADKKKAADAAKAVKASGPRVAGGKSITTRRGILTSTDGVITPADFIDGEAAIKRLLESGHLTK